MDVNFGHYVEDSITGFSGWITKRIVSISDTDIVEVTSTNRETKELYLDSLVIKHSGVYDKIKEKDNFNDFSSLDNTEYSLGDYVKDKYSEYSGYVTSIRLEPFGNIYYLVCSEYNQRNSEIPVYWLGENRLETF